MTILTNCTPFAASHMSVFDQHGRQLYVVVVSATFESRNGTPLSVADQQLPVHEIDVHRGEPASSSVIFEGEVAWHKPRVDVVLNGAAYAPAGHKAASVLASLHLGSIAKTLRVTGDRTWRTSPLGRRPGAPELFERMPIVYERAFGGLAAEAGGGADLRNLVGLGHRGARATAPTVQTEVPNVEYPDDLVSGPSDSARPAGFGILSRGWLPRQAYSGTYDDAWLATRAPLLPSDFDNRHFQVAPEDQQLDKVTGGERGVVLNMTPDGVWSFELPKLLFPIRLRYMDRMEVASFRLDTVIIEPDARRVALLGRAAVPLKRNSAPLQEIIVGDVSPGWLLARRRYKPYWGSAVLGGGGPKRNFEL